MGTEENSTRTFVHVQNSPYRFQSVMWAPEKGASQARFAVESQIYVTGLGWDTVDPMTQGNKFIVMLIDYIRTKEMLGYKHIGKTADELTTYFKNLWGKESLK